MNKRGESSEKGEGSVKTWSVGPEGEGKQVKMLFEKMAFEPREETGCPGKGGGGCKTNMRGLRREVSGAMGRNAGN